MRSTKQIEKTLNELAKKHEALTPEIVLAAARPKGSALHKCFCWDDTEAAKRYRLLQASQLIRTVKVTIEGGKKAPVTVRAYVNVGPAGREPDGKGFYVPVETALNKPVYREQLLEAALQDAKVFREKYQALEEAANIIAAIDEFTERRKAA